MADRYHGLRLTNISGSAGARGQSVVVNESFIDLLQRSEPLGAFMSYFEGRAGLYADFMWTKTIFGPVIGLRLRHEFSPTQNIMLRGDVGGFGLGSQFRGRRWVSTPINGG